MKKSKIRQGLPEYTEKERLDNEILLFRGGNKLPKPSKLAKRYNISLETARKDCVELRERRNRIIGVILQNRLLIVPEDFPVQLPEDEILSLEMAWLRARNRRKRNLLITAFMLYGFHGQHAGDVQPVLQEIQSANHEIDHMCSLLLRLTKEKCFSKDERSAEKRMIHWVRKDLMTTERGLEVARELKEKREELTK